MQVAIETIYVIIQTFVYSLLLYTMIGFEWKVAKVLWFYYFILMCFIYFTLYGMMVVALTPGHQIAAIVMSFFLSFWNLFSGFLIPRTVCPFSPCFRLWFFFFFSEKKKNYVRECFSGEQSLINQKKEKLKKKRYMNYRKA